MRSMPTRNRSMLGLAAKPSMERCSSAKRRRNDYDVSDMIMPHMSGAGGPKFVERVQVSQPHRLPCSVGLACLREGVHLQGARADCLMLSVRPVYSICSRTLLGMKYTSPHAFSDTPRKKQCVN